MRQEKIILGFIIGASIYTNISCASSTDYYSNFVPSSSDSSMYYAMGGGNIVPNSPSTTGAQTINVGGSMGLGYNCGTFNPTSSIANSLNGIKNSFQNMFNSAVTNAKGAVMSMPAYLIARNNPSLYQLLQNGFQSGQLDFSAATKSCGEMQSEIDTGKNPYKNFFKSSLSNDWKNKMSGSSSVRSNGALSYEAAEDSDIGQAKEKVNEDNGKNGVPWTHGTSVGDSKHAGGSGQPAIALTYDVVMAGVNAVIGESDYSKDYDIPKTVAMHGYWVKSSEVAKWAEAVLGEKQITTYDGGAKSSTPGKGLLPEVQTTFEKVYPLIVKMVSGETEITNDNLKNISTSSVVLNESIIDTLKHSSGVTQNIQINSLAQGVASGRVVDQAQMLIQVLQSAEQVPAISNNSSAQDQIQKYITTLKTQINMVVTFKETNQKLITSNIQAIIANQNAYNAKAAMNRPSANVTLPTGGVVKINEKE